MLLNGYHDTSLKCFFFKSFGFVGILVYFPPFFPFSLFRNVQTFIQEVHNGIFLGADRKARKRHYTKMFTDLNLIADFLFSNSVNFSIFKLLCIDMHYFAVANPDLGPFSFIYYSP